MLSVLRHSPTEPPGCLDCMLGSGSAVSCWMFEWFRIQSFQSLGRIGLSILRCLESFASFLHPILGQIWEVPSVGGTRYWLIFGLFWDKSLLDYNWRTIFRLVMKYMDAPLELEMWNEQCCNQHTKHLLRNLLHNFPPQARWLMKLLSIWSKDPCCRKHLVSTFLEVNESIPSLKLTTCRKKDLWKRRFPIENHHF